MKKPSISAVICVLYLSMAIFTINHDYRSRVFGYEFDGDSRSHNDCDIEVIFGMIW